MTWTDTVNQYLAEGRTVSGAKGDKVAAAQMQRANDLQQKELDLQTGILNKIQAGVGKYLSGDVGFDPQQLAIMRSQFLNQNTSDFQNASKDLTSMLNQRGSGGGQLPVGGDFARDNSDLLGMRAVNQSQGLANIDMTNLQQMLANKFNAASVVSGNAATLNGPIGTFGSMSSNALQQYIQAKNTGFGASFANSFGKALGNTLGGGNLNFNVGMGSGGCWVAASFYGWDDVRTHIVRQWMLNDAPKWFRKLYLKHGQWIAKTGLRWLFRPVFESVLWARG